MRARLGFLAVWTATTAAGVAISWAGVGDAMRGTALPGTDPAAEVPVLHGRPPTPTPAPSTPATATPGTGKPSPGGGKPSARPTPTRPATPSATPSARPTEAAPSPTSSAPAGNVRTYTVESGRVVLALTSAKAGLVSATPDSGFEVKVWRQTGWLRVDLTDGVHGSAVFATWNGHAPLVEVYEY